jgi:hypothetical protein
MHTNWTLEASKQVFRTGSVVYFEHDYRRKKPINYFIMKVILARKLFHDEKLCDFADRFGTSFLVTI